MDLAVRPRTFGAVPISRRAGLQTARLLGIGVPPGLLAIADVMIE
jgi:hypothetical protein